MWPTRVALRLNLLFWIAITVAGFAVGCWILAGSFFFGHFDLRLRPQKRACRAGDAAACLAVGDFYETRHSVFGGWATAQKYYDQGCDAGSARACLALVRISATDDAIWSDANQLRGFGRACTAGLAEGCFQLGVLYETGTPPRQGFQIKPDEPRSTASFARACQGGHAEACFWLGLAYRAGRGVTLDLERARNLFKLACEHGADDGCRALH